MTQGIPGTSFNAQSTSFSAATGVLGCRLVLSFGPRGMDKRDVQKYWERPFAAENDIDWVLKDIPGIS